MALNPPHLIAAHLTPSPYTRKAHLHAAAATCRSINTARTQSDRAVTNHKCTTQISLRASRHRLPSLDSQEAQWANRTGLQHQLSLNQPPLRACQHPAQASQRANNKQSSTTRTEQRQSTATKQIPTTATRFRSRNTRSSKSRMSADDGGKRRRRTETRELFPAIMFVLTSHSPSVYRILTSHQVVLI